MSVESALLVLLLVAPFAMIGLAVRVRKARELAPSSTAKIWDKSFRSAMLVGLCGMLLLLAGTGAFRHSAPAVRAAFALPLIAGVVALVRAYRLWMRGVAQVPDDAKP